MVASYNDYRRGDGNCYAAYSLDGGKSWSDTHAADGVHTRRRRTARPAQYWQGGGDTSVAFDTKGNAYLSCQMFMRGSATTPNPDLSSAFFVFRSTEQRRRVVELPGTPGRPELRTWHGEDAPFLDKQLMTVDNHVGSPFQDRVYVTWTTFDVDGTAYIWEAWSNDYARALQRPGARQQRQRPVRQHLRRCRRRMAAATRTSSRSRSPAATARCTSCGRTSTTSSRAPTTATRCCSPSRRTAG